MKSTTTDWYIVWVITNLPSVFVSWSIWFFSQVDEGTFFPTGELEDMFAEYASEIMYSVTRVEDGDL